MKHVKTLILLLACCASLLSGAEKQPNVLLICVDDLRPELACFGASYIHSPNIDRLAANGRSFHRHYVQAPTCGASRYTMLTGQYGRGGNQALFQRAAKIKADAGSVPPSMPAWVSRTRVHNGFDWQSFAPPWWKRRDTLGRLVQTGNARFVGPTFAARWAVERPAWLDARSGEW